MSTRLLLNQMRSQTKLTKPQTSVPQPKVYSRLFNLNLYCLISTSCCVHSLFAHSLRSTCHTVSLPSLSLRIQPKGFTQTHLLWDKLTTRFVQLFNLSSCLTEPQNQSQVHSNVQPLIVIVYCSVPNINVFSTSTQPKRVRPKGLTGIIVHLNYSFE